MAEEKPVGRPFQKGVSGNPGGRSKAYRELARYIREKTTDGRTLADHCLRLVDDPKTEPRVAMLAVEWLSDRGIGKPVQAVDLRIEDEAPPEAEIDWDAVPLEKRKAYLAMLDELELLQRKPDGGGDSNA